MASAILRSPSPLAMVLSMTYCSVSANFRASGVSRLFNKRKNRVPEEQLNPHFYLWLNELSYGVQDFFEMNFTRAKHWRHGIETPRRSW
jgi:hypothetical protein